MRPNVVLVFGKVRPQSLGRLGRCQSMANDASAGGEASHRIVLHGILTQQGSCSVAGAVMPDVATSISSTNGN